MLRIRMPQLGAGTTVQKIFANVGGVWKQGVYFVNVGGVWKQATVYVNVGGTWRLV